MAFAQRRITKCYILLLAIVLIGLCLRVYHLGIENIWMDEAIAIYESKLSLAQLLQASSQLEANPPLYFFILHYWIALFGDSEFALRFLSVVFGVLAIPMTFVVGRQLFDEEVGLLGALILALSGFNIQYSQEARMYSLMLLLALLSIYFFLQLLRKSTRAISAGYIIATTLLLYTHYYGLFVLLAQNIYLVVLFLLTREKTVRLKRWVVLQAIVAGLFAPGIYVFLGQTSTAARGFWISIPTLDTFRSMFIVYTGTVRLSTVFFELYVLFVVVLSVLALFRYTKVTGSMDWKAPLKALGDYSWNVHLTNVTSVALLVVWLLTLNVIPFVISRFSTPIYVARYTITASVALYLLVASGVRNINWRYVKIGVIALIVIISAVNLQSYYYLSTINYNKGKAQEAFNFINTQVKSGDVVIVYPGEVKHIYDYYGRVTNANVTPFPVANYYVMSFTYKNIAENIKELQSDVNGHDRVWFVSGTGFGNATLLSQAKTALNESYDIRSSHSYRGYDVLLYEKRA